MPFPNIDPIAISIGPIAIRWYALAYLFGVILGAGYGYLLLRNQRLWHRGAPPFKASDIWDFAFWAMLAIVIGGRVGYVLFYNLPYYLENPAEIINMSLGGGGSCASTYQDAINGAISRGTTVVVAAGNEADNASKYQPASCEGVVTVGATRITGGITYYSNYGARVDLSGPGGGGNRAARRNKKVPKRKQKKRR